MNSQRPSKSELQELKNHEPSAEYELLEAPGISQGRQSRVSVVNFKFGERYEPIIWKRMAAGKHLTHDEAAELEPRIRTYRRSLREHGWNVPKINHSHITQVEDEWQIWSYDQYIEGGDGDFLVKNPDVPAYQKWYTLRTIIETLAEYPTDSLRRWETGGKTLTGLIHGIDLKLANTVYYRNMVWFVDLFGPKEIEWTPSREISGERLFNPKWLAYNKKLDSLDAHKLLLVCATREGSILRLYRLAEELWVETGQIDPKALREQFIKILSEVSLPEGEQDFIIKELESNYKWLNAIYTEKHV